MSGNEETQRAVDPRLITGVFAVYSRNTTGPLSIFDPIFAPKSNTKGDSSIFEVAKKDCKLFDLRRRILKIRGIFFNFRGPKVENGRVFFDFSAPKIVNGEGFFDLRNSKIEDLPSAKNRSSSKNPHC